MLWFNDTKMSDIVSSISENVVVSLSTFQRFHCIPFYLSFILFFREKKKERNIWIDFYFFETRPMPSVLFTFAAIKNVSSCVKVNQLTDTEKIAKFLVDGKKRQDLRVLEGFLSLWDALDVSNNSIFDFNDIEEREKEGWLNMEMEEEVSTIHYYLLHGGH